MVILPAVDTTYTMWTGLLILRGRGDWEWTLLGMTLAAASMMTMLLLSMRLGADGTPVSTLTVEVCMPPFATVLAEGDTGVMRSGPNKAWPAEDVDGLVVQGLRMGACLGIPDVEIDSH